MTERPRVAVQMPPVYLTEVGGDPTASAWFRGQDGRTMAVLRMPQHVAAALGFAVGLYQRAKVTLVVERDDVGDGQAPAQYPFPDLGALPNGHVEMTFELRAGLAASP